MNQLSIFDIAPEPVAEPLPAPKPVPVVSPVDPRFDFPCDVPQFPDYGTILKTGDRVIILVRKYSHLAHVPGIVKGFVWDGIVVQRRDGEGLYEREELHLHESTVSL